MTVVYDNLNWTKGKNGYYQATFKRFTGKKWLHQYVYEKQICVICGKFFNTDRYRKALSCSRHCQNIIRAKTIKERKNELQVC